MLKKIKSLFVVDDEEQTKTNAKAQGSAQKTSPESKATTNEPNIKVDKSVPKRGEGKPDEKFVTRLLEAIEEHNIEGFDYLEYKQSLQSLGSMEMDEATKFKSSLAMAKTMGGTPEKLISSAQHYIKVLKNEETKFQSALENQHNKIVTSTKAQLTSLEQGIKQREEQITKLQAEIEQAKEQLKNKNSSVEGNLLKIETTKTGFYAAYHIVVDQITTDLEKMKKYLS